jgi:hypothetical protein
MSTNAAIMFLSVFWMALSLPAPATEERPLVYCFGCDETADEVSAYFCKQLAEQGRKENTFEPAGERDAAHAEVELKGIDPFSTYGETTVLSKGADWSPEQHRIRAEAVLRVGQTTRSFTGEGTLYEATAEVVEAIETWIRENPDAFR